MAADTSWCPAPWDHDKPPGTETWQRAVPPGSWPRQGNKGLRSEVRGTVRARPGSSCHRPSPGPQVPARRGRGARGDGLGLPAAELPPCKTLSRSCHQQGRMLQEGRTSPEHGEVPGQHDTSREQGSPHPRGKEGAQGWVEAELKGPYPCGPRSSSIPPSQPLSSPCSPMAASRQALPPRLCFPALPAQPGRAAGWSLMIRGAAWEQGTVGTQGMGV